MPTEAFDAELLGCGRDHALQSVPPAQRRAGTRPEQEVPRRLAVLFEIACEPIEVLLLQCDDPLGGLTLDALVALG